MHALSLFRDNELVGPKRKRDHNDELLQAAKDGKVSDLNNALKNGADVNATDNNRWTALMFAAHNGHMACLEALLATNADPNLQSKNEETALMFAAQNGHMACLKALLANGANPNLQSKDGRTALMVASQNGNQDCVQILEAAAAAKENQADPSELDDEINEAIDQIKKIYADRRLRLKQDYEVQLSLLQDRQPNASDLNALHEERVQRAVGRCPGGERVLKEREELRKKVRELELKDTYTAELAELNEAEQTELRKIEAKRQELHQKYSEAYVADHRCAVCLEIKESLGVAYGCGHRVCKGCAEQWKDSCPSCRHQSGTHPIHASVRSRGQNTIE